MAKVIESTPLERQKRITLVMAIASSMMKELNIKEKLNQAIEWDKSHWSISPGGLLTTLMLCTFTDMRIPLTHMEERLYGTDISYLIDEEADMQAVNSFNVGRALERLGETDNDGIYEQVALTALQVYNIPATKMHSDTTTISFYGEYDIRGMKLTPEEEEELLKIEKGYNKDGRPECKQVLLGQVTNEDGIPLISRTLNGAVSDVEWNKQALDYLMGLKETGFGQGIYVADCKLIVEEIVLRMTKKETRVSFVSRCPTSFNNKLEKRMIKQAYRQGNWEDIGAVGGGKKASKYRVSTSYEYYYGCTLRLIVMESSTLKERAAASLDKKMSELKPAIKALEKKEFACLANAKKEYARFMKDKKWSLFQNEYEIIETVNEKWPPGRRSEATRPIAVTSYKIRITQTGQKERECRQHLQNESCIVLISNVIDETVTDRCLIETYKGQQTVENSFRQFKGPNLASVIYLKNPARIQALTMILSLALLLRALIQYRLRDGLKKHNEENPGVPIMAGWGGRPLKSPTYKLLYEHSINCYYQRESWGKYRFVWPYVETKQLVESLLALMGLTVKSIMQ